MFFFSINRKINLERFKIKVRFGVDNIKITYSKNQVEPYDNSLNSFEMIIGTPVFKSYLTSCK